MKKHFLLVLFLLGFSAQAANNTALINLMATIPNTCTIQVLENVNPLILGEAIRTQSLQRFTVPVQVECNSFNSVLSARPYPLTNLSAPGYEIYYHINSSNGVSQGFGWLNTSFTSLAPIAQFNEPTREQIYIYIEGFKETSNRIPPSGDYRGLIELSIDAP